MAELPTPGQIPPHPSAAGTTPGLAAAGGRYPGQPTVPDWDPVSLTRVIQMMANEQSAVPPASAAAPLGVPGSPTNASVPSAPASPGFSPAYSGVAGMPFAAPLDFASIAAVPDPFPGLGTAFSVPLLDGYEPDVATPERVPTYDVPAPDLAPAEPRPAMPGVPAPRDATTTTTTAPELDLLRPISIDAFEIVPTGDRSVLALDQGPLAPGALKSEFPILDQTVNGRRLVWLDNAATTQKPQVVIDRLKRFYERENSNVHRAAHTLAARSTDAYESARDSVRRFIHAPSASEIVFVRGTTEGINLVAQSWGRRNVGAGDEVVITWLEHHANIVPWQMLCSEKGAKLKVAPVDDRGQIIMEEYEKLLGPKTKIVSFTQVSNALGTITPAGEMIALAHRHGAKVLLDGAQAVSHMPVDVQELGADFFVFSGHKVFAPTGIGAVWGRKELLDSMPPWQGGGNMIQDVTFERTIYQAAPARFEAGTGNIADAVGLGAALDWLTRVGIERVEAYEHGLLNYATERLAEVPGLRMIGTAPEKAGVLSFVLDGQKTEEVGGLLDQEGIAVRSGHHCAQPILRRYGLEATVRASLAPYNTQEDIDALVAALKRLQAGHQR
jgi:cysteine desulfurase/selenocysteine lyase